MQLLKYNFLVLAQLHSEGLATSKEGLIKYIVCILRTGDLGQYFSFHLNAKT